MPHTAPVQDWATDFDVLDPRYVSDPFSIWDDLRQRCPLAHTDRRKSSWLPTRYDDVTAIAHDIAHFSSLKVAVIPGDEDEDPNADFDGPNLEYGLPPISSDPPLHTWTRRLLLPWFSHTRVDSYVPLTRELCRGLLDRFADRGSADAEVDGKPVDDGIVLGMAALVLIAGVDTTWSAIGSSLWHLAAHPDDRKRLAAEPALMPTAVEELLRAYR